MSQRRTFATIVLAAATVAFLVNLAIQRSSCWIDPASSSLDMTAEGAVSKVPQGLGCAVYLRDSSGLEVIPPPFDISAIAVIAAAVAVAVLALDRRKQHADKTTTIVQ